MPLTPEDLQRMLYEDGENWTPKRITANTTPKPKSKQARPVKPRRTIEQRFWPKVDKDGPIPEHCPELGPCWIWTGSLRTGGYGQFRVNGTLKATHNVAYELLRGPVTEGMTRDHLCLNRRCCNPWHLEEVTSEVNLLRGNGWSGRNAKKTHCPNGHPYDMTVKGGGRRCSRCYAEAQKQAMDRYNAKRRDIKKW